jgi:hypothetical protein
MIGGEVIRRCLSALAGGVVLFMPTLAGCGILTSVVTQGHDLNDCLVMSSEVAERNGAGGSDPTLVLAATTSVVVQCLGNKGIECSPESSAGEWSVGSPKQYECMGPDGTGFTFSYTAVANALRDIGVTIPTSLG